MSTIKINEIEPNAYINWIKDSFKLFKRAPILFIFLAMLPAILLLKRVNVFPILIVLPFFYSVVISFFTLKTDYNLSIKETLNGFDLKDKGFFNTFGRPHYFEILFCVFFLVLNTLAVFFVPENTASSENANEKTNYLFMFLMPFIVSFVYGAVGILSSFNGYFNLFFGILGKMDFNSLYKKDLIGSGKSFKILCVIKFFVFFIYSSLYYSSLEYTETQMYLIMASLPLIAFATIIECVAFRELFIGRGKNKEIKETQTDINAATNLG